ncbi:MAG: hypothetical protein CME05_00810, partial [Gemmatimonadaceae bacterium]|nr:hypothetical protein [Gemmatimonadaceae bacterium]
LVGQLKARAGLEKSLEKLLGQVIDPKGVLEAGMTRSWIDEMHKTELADVAKTLEVFGVYQSEQRGRDVHVAPNGVTNRLAVVVEKWMGNGHRAG